MTRTLAILVVLASLAGSLVAGCGGDGGDDPATTRFAAALDAFCASTTSISQGLVDGIATVTAPEEVDDLFDAYASGYSRAVRAFEQVPAPKDAADFRRTTLATLRATQARIREGARLSRAGQEDQAAAAFTAGQALRPAAIPKDLLADAPACRKPLPDG